MKEGIRGNWLWRRSEVKKNHRFLPGGGTVLRKGRRRWNRSPTSKRWRHSSFSPRKEKPGKKKHLAKRTRM